jgi:hypothetical protein
MKCLGITWHIALEQPLELIELWQEVKDDSLQYGKVCQNRDHLQRSVNEGAQ